MTSLSDPVLVVVPAFGSPEYTDGVLDDLLDADPARVPNLQIVVMDNGGDYQARRADERLTVRRTGENLRWIGSANWAFAHAIEHGFPVGIVLNNDTRLSTDFVYEVARTFADCVDVALAAPCYDDFWVHQRARSVPTTAAAYRPALAYRDVPFCDGTALAFSAEAIAKIGPLDTVAFTRHGYGADIDLALRAREAGMRCVITESAYLHHIRRGTMNRLADETSERNRHEILTGMDAKWGPDWRARVGLGPGAFPPHNTGSATSWYL